MGLVKATVRLAPVKVEEGNQRRLELSGRRREDGKLEVGASNSLLPDIKHKNGRDTLHNSSTPPPPTHESASAGLSFLHAGRCWDCGRRMGRRDGSASSLSYCRAAAGAKSEDCSVGRIRSGPRRKM